MHGPQDYLVGLAQLHRLPTVEERRAIWRQGMASLAAAAGDQQPTPLEGLAPDDLLASFRVAVATGLVDDLGFLSRPVAAAALFELAAALPPCPEKRDLGRRVLTALHEGDAPTFVTLATSLALASRRGLQGVLVKARVALSLRLPISSGTAPDALALAIVSRPELEREWLTLPSMGSLPSRRLAARLLERSAREAAHRAGEGDDSALRVFDRPTVQAAWARLLGDRESLVWRHAATARGLLVNSSPDRATEMERDLSPRLGPTEWRRAAAALGAHLAHNPANALARWQDMLKSDIGKKDPGVAGAMIFGLTRGAEEEPEAANDLLVELIRTGGIDAIEALVDLREEHAGSGLGDRAAHVALEKLQNAPRTTDDGLSALTEVLCVELDPTAPRLELPLRSILAAALQSFAEGRRLLPATDAALASAKKAMARLESNREENTAQIRRASFQALRELDMGLLETSTLSDLLALSGREGGASGLTEVLGRLHAWLIERESKAEEDIKIPHYFQRMRRLRTLLHQFDGDTHDDPATPATPATTGSASPAGHTPPPVMVAPPPGPRSSSSSSLLVIPAGTSAPNLSAATATPNTPAPTTGSARDRRLRSVMLVAARMRVEPPASPLRRTLAATVARGCDSLVRDDILELSDVLVAVLSFARTPDDLRILGEAALVPEVKDMLAAAAAAARPLGSAGRDAQSSRNTLEAFRSLANTLPPGVSARVEGLRRALLAMTRALETVLEASSLTELGRRDGSTPLERLEESVRYAHKLVAGARRRLMIKDGRAKIAGDTSLADLDAAIALHSRDMGEPLGVPTAAAVASLRARLPRLVAEVAGIALSRIPGLPAEAPAFGDTGTIVRAGDKLRLPPWLPPSRTLGGFYVLRPLGTGAGGSVFVVRRTDERHDHTAESFALKVPAYNGAAAHTLSEDEFLQLFREEAGALLTLPKHDNLAGFVTFDVSVRPKPILVMELVAGPTLERLLDGRAFSTPLALSVLQGIARGLGAMHQMGVGHLDLKPANVILRSQGDLSASRLITFDDAAPPSVLVDFGLAGRKVRPGCGSPYYAGPEIWDAQNFAAIADPRATDVYAFAALAFELLTGRTLFSADSLPALMTSHVTHDGEPPGLKELAQHEHLASLAGILSAGLAQDPRARASVADLAGALESLHPDLGGLSWPLGAETRD